MFYRHQMVRVLQCGVCIAFAASILATGMQTKAEAAPVGWTIQEDKLLYYDGEGNFLTGLQNIGNEVYLFLDDGSVYTGWITLEDRTFYFGDNGMMQRDTCLIDGVSYQFQETGDFLTGWYAKEEGIFFRNEYGYDQKGFVQIDGALYFINENGRQTGEIQTDDGTVVYADETGKIYTGDCKIGSKIYHFSETGQHLYGWKRVGDAITYMTSEGVWLTGAQEIDGEHYYFDMNTGVLAVNTTVGMYRADAEGKLTRMEVSAENLDAALDEILQQTGTDIGAIGTYVNGLLRYKHIDRLATREEMAVYAINNKRCSCYYYEALTGLLLERAGYEVTTINGKGFVYSEHYWSLVYTTRNGITGWYHVDALKAQYVKTDAEMVAKGFVWNHANFPATP